MKINCLHLRDKIASGIKNDVEKLKSRGVIPKFAIIQIGNYPPSDVYVRVKMKKAKEVGINAKHFSFPLNTPPNSLINLISKLNSDSTIHGIIIQRPLSSGFDEPRLQSLIDPKKDIDGLSENSSFDPPVALAVAEVLRHIFSSTDYRLLTTNCYLVVVGKGRTAGAPVYKYFSGHPYSPDSPNHPFSVVQIDSKTKNPDEILKSADIVVSCVGKPNIVRADNIKKGVILISVGQHTEKIKNYELRITNNNLKLKIEKLIENLKLKIENSGKHEQKAIWVGDYNEEEIMQIASAYAPTPYGIGPLNVIFLLKNVVNAANS